MKKSILYIAAILMASAGFASCDDDFTRPPMEEYIPTAANLGKVNTTAQQLKDVMTEALKAANSGSVPNYCNVEIPAMADGSHYWVKGRVTSTDEYSNIYKKLMIEDETGGLIFSIDNSKLYESYRIGQEVVIDCTGLYFGTYGTGLQIGVKADATSAPGRISKTDWESICEANGLANVDKLEIPEMTVEEMNALLSNDAEKWAWQGRLVKLTGVHFQTPGALLARVLAAGETNPNNTSVLVSAGGDRIDMNTSSYSDFGTTTYCPSGEGNVLAVVTLFNNKWQLVLNSADGLEGFTPWVPVDPGDGDGEGFTEGFDMGAIPANWGTFNLEGSKNWYVTSFNDNYYAAMTGYKGTAPFNAWLVTPVIDINKLTDKTLTFDTQVNGYGSTTTTFKVYVLDNYDPAKAKATELQATFATAPASGYSSWVSSGTIDLSAQKGKFYIAWQYAATTDDNYATWCVDNIVVK